MKTKNGKEEKAKVLNKETKMEESKLDELSALIKKARKELYKDKYSR